MEWSFDCNPKWTFDRSVEPHFIDGQQPLHLSDDQAPRVEEVRVRAKIAISVDQVVPNQSDRRSMMQ
jgi:hypothetical protein